MPRLTLLAALVFASALSAQAQTDPADLPPPTAADTVAVDSAAVVISPDPERALALYNEGLSLYRDDDFEGALAKYDESLLYGESFAPAGFGRGQALYNLGRLEDSRNALEAAVAMSRASDAPNAGQLQAASQQWLDTVTQTIEAREANAAAAQQQQAAASAAQEITEKVSRATEMLSGNEVTFEQGADAYALLEQAREAGYDADQAALYYAKALTAMERGADAVPYAETALAASEGQADRSANYIVLGQAHLAAGKRRRGPVRVRDDRGGPGVARLGPPTTSARSRRWSPVAKAPGRHASAAPDRLRRGAFFVSCLGLDRSAAAEPPDDRQQDDGDQEAEVDEEFEAGAVALGRGGGEQEREHGGRGDAGRNLRRLAGRGARRRG